MTLVRGILRGISQIFFVENIWSGLLILIAIAISNPHMALLVLLGSAVQSIGATLLGAHDEVEHGLMGYNGALVGAALGLELPHLQPGILLTILGALACIPVHRLFEKIFGLASIRSAGLPVSTAPFCTVAGLIYALVLPWISLGTPSSSSEPVRGAFLGIFNDFSEVVLADGYITGILILVALLIGSWRIGLFGLLGSAITVLVMESTHIFSAAKVSTGLLGYSAVLVAIALGVVFSAGMKLSTRLVLAVGGVVLTWVIQWLLGMTPLAVYTWPFLLAMWIILLATARTRKTV